MIIGKFTQYMSLGNCGPNLFASRVVLGFGHLEIVSRELGGESEVSL